MKTISEPPGAEPRVIGSLAGFTLVAGSMLGVGIFLFPAPVASEVNSLGLFFLVWALGGLVAVAGASACGEMGAMYPQAGGDYLFQREAFGPSIAFAAGWVLFGAIFCGSIAGMAVALFQYQGTALSGIDFMRPLAGNLPVPLANILAVILVIFLTWVNSLGTRMAMWLQIVLTLIPIVVLLIIGIYAINNNTLTGLPLPSVKHQGNFSIEGMVTALLYVNFAYSGWISIIYVAGEVKQPGKNIPKAMFSGTLAIMLVYLLLCAAFIFTLGYDGLASLTNMDAGTGMAYALGNETIGLLVTACIALAVITSLNASILTGSRVAFAMARDNAFWKAASMLNKKGGIPTRALWAQALIASLLVITGSFRAIVEMTSIAMFITGSITVLALFILRHKKPMITRPYLATGYPWLPSVYLFFSIIALVVITRETLAGDYPRSLYPLLGVGILIAAFTGHKIISRKQKNKTTR